MAEDDDDSSKTEDPTAKKLSDAREQGNLPISRDFSMWVLLLGAVFCVNFLFPLLGPHIFKPLSLILSEAGQIEIRADNFNELLGRFMGAAFLPVMGIVLLLAMFAVAGWIIQTGPMFNMSLIKLRWERLNPVEGFKKLFSANSAVELIKSMGKITVVGVVGYSLLKADFKKSEMMSGLDVMGMVRLTYDMASQIFFAVFLVFTIIMLIDVAYQRFTYFKNLRMTKSEVKEEFRQSEGDPHVKARLKGIRMEKAKKRMMAAVPKADVVITNPTHFAIALKYDAETMQAPVVLAKGQDFVALKIREIAEENKVPLVSNPPLARTLYATVDIDEEIPPEHYRAVAEVISYVYKLKKLRR